MGNFKGLFVTDNFDVGMDLLLHINTPIQAYKE